MFKRFFLLTLAILNCAAASHAAPSGGLLMQSTQPRHIFVNNRILAKVNGKPISVVDLMKKMDMIFYRQYPQYSSSPEARFQFYNMSWKHALEEMIEKELIMADAEEVKMEVSNGDIRQEMENLFGPNIIGNLDKAGLTYDEAWSIVKEDQTLKRMMGSRVNAKAVRAVTPVHIKAAYEEFAKDNKIPDSWRYETISIRGENPKLCAEVADFAYHLLVDEQLPIEKLEDKIADHPLTGDNVHCNVSDEYVRTDKEVSQAYRKILATMEPGTFSKPTSQKSRSKKSHVYRIFHLVEFMPGGAPPFPEVELKLKAQLTEKKANEETQAYFARLRKHFDVQGGTDNPLYPDDFQPFVLK